MSPLIAFRVSNFRSIAAEQELTLLAVDEDPSNISTPAGEVLPAVGVFGPNGSGKSALLEAIAYARTAVVTSYRSWDPEIGTYRVPHALGDYETEPSTFEFEFVVDGDTFDYRFELNDERVLAEQLFQRTTRKPRGLFVRDLDDYQFSRYLTGPKESIRELTRPNSLFLSSALQSGHRELTRVAGFFRRMLTRGLSTRRGPRTLRIGGAFPIARRLDPSGADYDDIVRLMRLADLGIEDLEVREEDERLRIFLSHRGQAGRLVPLPYEEESQGTVTWLNLVGEALTCLASGRLMILDELDRSLHPYLTAEFLRLFQDPIVNRNQAQLVFSSHDVSLLRADNKWRLRRDQLWLTEKNSEGATELVAATEFRGVGRKSKDLEDLYLEGRIGGTPVIDDTGLADLALSNAPSRVGRGRQASLFDRDDPDGD